LKERFAELGVKNWSDVAKNGCAEPYNEKILWRLMVHSFTLKWRTHTRWNIMLFVPTGRMLLAFCWTM